MIARSTVTFAELRQLLLDLGFSMSKRGKGWFFDHPPSETWFHFRPYQVREKVTLMDLHTTRKHLDWRDVLDEKAFDDRLKKASAIKRSTVVFAELRQFLLDLGFAQSKWDKFWLFKHDPSCTVFGFRPYRSNERVARMDLDHVRKYLDWCGVLSEKAFNDRLKKATA